MRNDTKAGRNIGKKQQKSLKFCQNIGKYELINETMKKSLDFAFYRRFLVENFGKKSLNFSTKYQANFLLGWRSIEFLGNQADFLGVVVK